MNASTSIERYSVGERATHAVAALTYVYLLITGLAFWTPALFWLSALAGGGYLARLGHPWVGLLFALALVRMHTSWRRDMHTTDEDRVWRRAMSAYARNADDEVPPVGRFNYGQKMLYWLMAGGGFTLLLSGLVMWNVASVPSDWHLLRAVATLVHAVAALATIGGFIVHIYMGVAVVPGGLHAIIHGHVSEEWARQHHALWLARLRTPRS